MKKGLDKWKPLGYYMQVDCDTQSNTEQYRSGHNGHDWKSCVPQKGTEGSNPSCSARKKKDFSEVLLFLLKFPPALPEVFSVIPECDWKYGAFALY